ncbi:MAG TPA: protoporphyrinogen oxidase, partial [Candidatus Acidoferrum sp.]
MANNVQALVVGAGISGLSTTFNLQKSGIETLLIEAASRPGGVIKSVKRDGYLIECGPQSFSGNGYITTLCEDLGILEERVIADSRAPRYVLINGKLQLVPMSPPSLLFSSLMGGGTRTAILRDIVGKSQAPEPDESVANFIRRKYS